MVPGGRNHITDSHCRRPHAPHPSSANEAVNKDKSKVDTVEVSQVRDNPQHVMAYYSETLEKLLHHLVATTGNHKDTENMFTNPSTIRSST
jgi:uncharacterized protein YecE (DUF72 family)